METYILSQDVDRSNLIRANREGLFSVWGYLTIYFCSVYVGKVMYSVKTQRIKDWAMYAARGLIHGILLWIMHQVSVSFGNPSCRRAANLSYSLWILATNYTILWVLVIISLVQAVVQHMGLLHGPLISYELRKLMEREDGKIKKLTQQLKKKCYGKSKREVEVEKTLSMLEDKLEEFMQSGKSSIYSEVAPQIKHLEEELALIGGQLEEEEEGEKDKEMEPTTTENNLITLPDLTKSPVTLEAICYNGLLVFLLGNLLTGLVNCLVNTVYAPDYLALSFLWAYVSVVSTVSVVLYNYGIQLKFW